MKITLRPLYLLALISFSATAVLDAQDVAPAKEPSKSEAKSAEKSSKKKKRNAAKSASKAEAKPEPKLEPKPEPQPEPEPAPQPEPKPAPAPKVDPEAERVEEMRKEISKLGLERELFSARTMHEKEKLAAEHADRRLALEKKKFEMEERTQRLADEELRRKELLDQELAELKLEAQKLKARQEIEAARAAAALNDLKLAEAEAKLKLTNMMTEISVKEKSREAAYYADREPQQLDNPLRGKRLVVSDRRIELNGPIGSSTAEHISTRINFYNNKDPKKPIFIVIDNSPGGSVMSGYKILRSMESSEAPIYVVVKQYAASMAATIATLADHSVAYPNAIILHHQLSAGMMGNLTEARESLEQMEEWWRRLADPIAKKMGITREEFIERMYKEISSGDWSEFADEAQKLKWIDHIVDEIHETALVKSPDARRPTTLTKTTVVPVRRTSVEGEAYEAAIPVKATGMELFEQIDEDGKPFVRLPRPNPVDYYYMHNPDNYYRFK